ncbi:MAG: glycosyltransferase family 4 protein [Armatimonadota bacterium]|nr:MAG: glycosyltransferase family 4 protein [Armatimonadota bacterium]
MLSWEFPPRIVGGIARHVDELGRALAGAGLEVDVLTAHHPGAPEREEIAARPGRLRVLRARPSPIHALDFVCEIHQLGFGLLERLLAEGETSYDLVHAHDWLVAFAGRTLKEGLALPLVATMHATETGRCEGIHTPTQHYIHSAEWLLTYDAWRVICCSKAMANEVMGALRVPPDKVRVVPNGLNPERVRCGDSPTELAAFRERWAAKKERIVLFVGRLAREKGVEVLIDAVPEVVAAHPEAKFVIAGGGESGHLRGRAAAKGLEHKVVFTGFVPEEDLARTYAVADVAVFPSLYEPFGIVALEAMAAGVPVVSSDIGGFREVIRHDVTGIHTWANNPHSLAAGIIRALSERGLAARLRRRAREEIGRRYDWGGIAEQTVEVYGEALGGRCEAAAPREAPVVGPGVRPRYLAAGNTVTRS